MAKRSWKGKPDGELRQSQVVTTFGPGAMVDFPDHSVVIGGLDFWYGNKRRIREERLEQMICVVGARIWDAARSARARAKGTTNSACR